MKSLTILIIFFIVNFGALFIGGLLMGEGPSGQWYKNLNIAPWTPPGFVFGLAWTTIMIAFSFYMRNITLNNTTGVSFVLGLFLIQLALNIGWNYAFFNLHMVMLSLVIICSLLIVLIYMLFKFNSLFSVNFWLLLPYVLWLCIATSLNAYILIKN